MKTVLNLLPPANKADLRVGFVLAYLQSILLVFLVATLFAAGTLVAMRMLVKGTYDDLARRATTTDDEYASLTTQTREINGYLKRIDGITKRAQPWSSFFRSVTELVPAAVRIERLQTDSEGTIFLSGTAATRADVLTLGDRLRASGLFSDVRSPLSNILTQKDVKFDFEMTRTGFKPPAAKK